MSGPQRNIQTQERLIGDLRQVIENAEELLKNTGQYQGSHYQAARAKLAAALQTAVEELARFEDEQLERMMELTARASKLHNDLTGEALVMRAFRTPPPSS
ncbi:DUF883 family protein [Oxalobacteraceae bacterium A2-2]